MDGPPSLWSQTIAMSLQFGENLVEISCWKFLKLAVGKHLLQTWLPPPTPSSGSHDTHPQAVRVLPHSDTRSPMSLMQHKAAWFWRKSFAVLRASCPGSHLKIVPCFSVTTAFLGHIHPPPEDASARRLTGTNSHKYQGSHRQHNKWQLHFQFSRNVQERLCWLHWKLCCKQAFYRAVSWSWEKHFIF